MTTNLDQLLTSLEHQTDQLINHVTSTVKLPDNEQFLAALVASLELDKITVNMDYARSIILDLEADMKRNHKISSCVTQYRGVLKQSSVKLQNVQHDLRSIRQRQERQEREQQQRRQQQEQEQQRRQQHEEASFLDTTENLRQRRPSIEKRDHSSTMHLSEKLAGQQNFQESLSGDILGMVNTLKKNALLFAEKISQDTDVVNSAANALNKSSATMSKTGSKLTEYRATKAIGFWFYIYAAIFIAVAAVIGGLVVKL